MNSTAAFLKPTADGMYRRGEPARITGVRTLQPKGSPARVAYEVEYADGRLDCIPVAPTSAYELLASEEVRYAEVTSE